MLKKIKRGKRSAVGSEISDNQSIVYKSSYIEESRIGRNLSRTDIKYGSQSHSWNYEYHAFDYQLDQWDVDKLFQNSDEVIIRELKVYIEHWGTLHINDKRQLLCTMFLAKYVSLDIYDEDPEKIFIIDYEKLQFDKKSGWNLIGIP